MENYRVNLAPLRFGAGLKGKVFDGLASGTPTIPTPIATDTRLSSQPLPKMTACRTLFPAFATPLITLGAIATTPRQQKPSGSATATKDDY